MGTRITQFKIVSINGTILNSVFKILLIIVLFNANIFSAQAQNVNVKDIAVTNQSLQLNAGIQQIITPNNTMNSYNFQSLQYKAAVNTSVAPLVVTGRLNVVNGVLMTQNSGFGIQVDKSKLDAYKNKLTKLKSLEDSLPSLNTDSIGNNLKDSVENAVVGEANQITDSLKRNTLDSLNTLKSDLPDTSFNKPNLDLKGINPNIAIGDISDTLSGIKPPKIALPDTSISKTKLDSLDKGRLQTFAVDKVKGNVERPASVNPKFSKISNFILKVKDFSIGLSTLSVSDLICNATPYQGMRVEYSVSEKTTVAPVIGVTNKFPSLSQLIQKPQLLSGFSGNPSVLSSPGALSLQANSLYFNRDLLNLSNRVFFTGLSYKTRLKDSTGIILNHYYSKSLSRDNPGYAVANVSSLTLSREHKYYAFRIELANSVITGRENAINSDSLPNLAGITNANLSPAFAVSGKFKISKGLNVKLGYRTLSPFYYSPLQLFNNNLLNQFSVGTEIKLLKNKFQLASDASTSAIRTQGGEKRMRTVSQSFSYAPFENFQVNATFSYGIMGDSLQRGENKVFSAGFLFIPRKLKTLQIQGTFLSYQFDQTLSTDSLLKSYSQGTLSANYQLSKTKRLNLSADYGFAPNVKYTNEKFQYFFQIKKNIELIAGVSHIQLGNQYWVNTIAGIQIIRSKKFNLSFVAERSIISSDQPMTTGSIQSTLIF